MAKLNEQIKTELKEAMKAKDVNKRDTLRMLDSMLKNVEIAKGKRESGLTEEEITEVITKAVKQRKDSVAQYTLGGRPELAQKEQDEIDILVAYLPEQISKEELLVIIKDVVSDNLTEGKNDIGKIMGLVMGRVKGKADGNLVRELVSLELELK